MLQELATQTGGAEAWAIGALIFFVAFYALVALRTWRVAPRELAARARMPLDDEPQVGDPAVAPPSRS